MFGSIYTQSVTPGQFFLMAAASLISGILFSFLMSFRVRANRRFFIVTSVIPCIVGMVLTFVNGNIGAGVAFGMGYIAYGVLALIGMGLVFLALSSVKLFDHAGLQKEKLLRVTIPESLDYTTVFDDTFGRFCKSAESVGVKTTGMGSLFRLSFRITMKDPGAEKALIDELRTKNGNLEIALVPYVEEQNQL